MGGRLIYSTCTILDKENSHIVKEFIENNPDFVLNGEECILPDENQGHDGFYVALMTRERRSS